MDPTDTELHTPATIAQAVKRACNASPALHGTAVLRVRGVVANRGHKGHLYFTLRQEVGADGQPPARPPSLECVMYLSKVTGEALGHVANGQVVEVSGMLAVYPPKSAYQCNVLAVRPVEDDAAASRTRLAVERRAAEEEGLLAQSAKRPAPSRVMRRVAVLTSAQGDAYKDFVGQVEGYPVSATLVPVAVQGASCVPDHVRVLALLARREAEGGPSCRFDAIVLTRGGGGAADLEGYDRLELARAVYRYRQSGGRAVVVSAIGHTNDTPLLDDAVDEACPTPTAAARRIVAEYDRWRAVAQQQRAAAQADTLRAAEELVRFRAKVERTFSDEAMLAREARLHDAHVRRVHAHLDAQQRRWEAVEATLRASPLHVLSTTPGFAHVTTVSGAAYEPREGTPHPPELELHFAVGTVAVRPGGTDAGGATDALHVPAHLTEDVQKYVARRQRQLNAATTRKRQTDK